MNKTRLFPNWTDGMNPRVFWPAVLCLLLTHPLTLTAQTSYRLTRDQVVIDQAVHWAEWEAPVGTHVITAEGAVLPRFLRRDINAALNAMEFETPEAGGDTLVGGIRRAGSSAAQAPFIMDGNQGTYWEPDPADPLKDWFVDVELGRSVIAKRVVVRFAQTGDPFLKFRVLLSDGRGHPERPLKFFRVGQVTYPNKTEREFSFEVRPQRPLPAGVEGEVAQVVRFQALASDSTRSAEVDRATYEALSPADQGTVEYFRQTVIGRQILIDEQTHRDLPEEERGLVRYFRRERPRLAELEVYTLGDNVVTVTQRLRNRNVSIFENILLELATDGLFRSFYPLKIYDSVRDRNQLIVDLGARFWLDRVRLVSAEGPLSAYQLRISDGSLDPDGSLVWEALEQQQNRESFLQLEEQFSLREVRHLELKRLELVIVGEHTETGNLSEIQAYGEGYVSKVELESPVISLGRSRIFSTVEWDGDQPPGTQLEIRTRSGDEVIEERRYFDVVGQEISQEEWEAIRYEKNRGEVLVREIPGPGWSNWSAVYLTSGEPFKSPSPRRFAQVQIRLLTQEPLRTAQMRSLRLKLAPPLVDQTFAEVWPIDGVAPGEDQLFSMYIRSVFGPGNSGFDRIRLHSSSSVPIELISFREGSEAQLRAGTGRELWPGPLHLERLEDGSVELAFPAPVTGGRSLYEARFRTRVFLSGTVFGAELKRATRPGIVQAISEGDAGSLAASQSLVVVADVENFPLLDRVRSLPEVFTPNGDGINDQAEIRFTIYRLIRERRIEVVIYDLSGRKVRELSLRRENPSGDHSVVWDGRDDAGVLVRPGTYLVCVAFSADVGAEKTQAASLVGVVY
ncbi:MAG: gliding motility-associated C-terminal domain-containing protein [Gemmatimonadota bacterium]|nr:gliding motility-associated C-terminal domain-containing protein [Gemmatimonadota bacterium]